MMNNYILMPIDIIEQSGERCYLELDNDSISMIVERNSSFMTKNGKHKKISELKPGDEIYVEIFNEDNITALTLELYKNFSEEKKLPYSLSVLAMYN